MTESRAGTIVVSAALLALAAAVIIAFSNDNLTPPVAAQKSEPFPLISVIADSPPVVAIQDQPRIDVKALEETLFTLRKDNPEDWLKAFEKRVNEIYEGDEVVSVRAENVDGGGRWGWGFTMFHVKQPPLSLPARRRRTTSM